MQPRRLGCAFRTEFRKIPENFRFRTHFRPFFSDSDSASERKNRSRHRSPRLCISFLLINYLPATNLCAVFRRKFLEFRNRRRKFRFRTLQRGVRFQQNSQPRSTGSVRLEFWNGNHHQGGHHQPSSYQRRMQQCVLHHSGSLKMHSKET